eukprot:CAMPEP_0205918324 /NCGR_PEP_ID=MMETSP1325-20131115/9725_1 /ASSEMBLY_ACC=CAM_ASM_000708 /TAXON_ID=236786 /ORGANISM="Florenciella sp., Strain RCC1007" /LENGTH=87 /DNA_ID=CAMNT_0053285837 /DNA_START=206 /DNA_END=465 /DNA_ORIENTATION=+
MRLVSAIAPGAQTQATPPSHISDADIPTLVQQAAVALGYLSHGSLLLDEAARRTRPGISGEVQGPGVAGRCDLGENLVWVSSASRRK